MIVVLVKETGEKPLAAQALHMKLCELVEKGVIDDFAIYEAPSVDFESKE